MNILKKYNQRIIDKWKEENLEKIVQERLKKIVEETAQERVKREVERRIVLLEKTLPRQIILTEKERAILIMLVIEQVRKGYNKYDFGLQEIDYLKNLVSIMNKLEGELNE